MLLAGFAQLFGGDEVRVHDHLPILDLVDLVLLLALKTSLKHFNAQLSLLPHVCEDLIIIN